MPTDEQFAEWREQYGSYYLASFRQGDYYFRALTVGEHARILADRDLSTAEIEDTFVSTALLSPEIADTLPAGIYTSLADQILNVSGFGDAKTAKRVLDEQRANYGGVVGLMKAFIIATQPTYREEELDDCTFAQLAAKVALAENIIKVQQAVLPLASGGEEGQVKLNLVDPEEEAAKEQIEAQKHTAQKKSGQAGFNDPIAQRLHQALG